MLFGTSDWYCFVCCYSKVSLAVHWLVLTALSDVFADRNNFKEGKNWVVYRCHCPVVVGPELFNSQIKLFTSLKSLDHMFNCLFLSSFKCLNCFVGGFSWIIMKKRVEWKHLRKDCEFEFSGTQRNRKTNLMLLAGWKWAWRHLPHSLFLCISENVPIVEVDEAALFILLGSVSWQHYFPWRRTVTFPLEV